MLARLLTTLTGFVLVTLLLLLLAGLLLPAAVLLVSLRIALLLLVAPWIVLALIVRHGMFSGDFGIWWQNALPARRIIRGATASSFFG
jgi:hypothetical protein